MRPATLCLPLLLPAPPFALQERPRDDRNPLTETQRIQHMLSRFAFGSRPGLVEEVRRKGLSGWFEEQVAGRNPESQRVLDRLAGWRSVGMSNQEILKTYVKPRPPKATPKQIRELNRLRNVPRDELLASVLYRAIYGANQVQETLSDFFRNHFNITVNKGNCRYYANEWEREVIRGGVFGSFRDLLGRSAKHPAMLYYLDNYISRRPPTKQELKAIHRNVRRRTKSRERADESVEIAKQRGLNENYARELLELHTLGVDNYYRQKDVIEVAKALTGWTIQQNAAKPVGFLFRKDMHQRGDKFLLGRRISQDRKNPVSEGEAVIERLAKHKGTSMFLARKLCEWFVDDHPPEVMLRRIASAFRTARGDLPSVYRAIIEDPEFFSPRHFQSKFKRPFEFLVSAVRVTGAEVASTGGLLRALTAMSEPLYMCEDPTGYYDKAEAWIDPGVMATRWKFAMDFVRGRISGVRIPASLFEDLHPKLPQAWKDQLAKKVLPAGLSEATSWALDRKIREFLAKNPQPDVRNLAPLILGMLLGSPEFQRQ